MIFPRNEMSAESSSFETIEEGRQEPAPVPQVESGNEVAVGPCETSRWKCKVTGVFACILLLLTAAFLGKAVVSENQQDVSDNLWSAGLLFMTFSIFLLLTLRYAAYPAWLWRYTVHDARNRRMRFRDCRRASGEDVENQPIERAESLPESEDGQASLTESASFQDASEDPRSDPSSSASSEKALVTTEPTASGEGSSTVSKISEVAAAISHIVSGTISGEGETLEASQSSESSTNSKYQSVEEISGGNLKNDSETELMSSGEVRRRKFPNPEDLKDSSNSSDEELVKKQ